MILSITVYIWFMKVKSSNVYVQCIINIGTYSKYIMTDYNVYSVNCILYSCRLFRKGIRRVKC